jgi:hypothetical protein
MLVNQGFKGCPNCGGGGSIREFEIANGVSIGFVLNNLRE